jgi:hypothetical protein
LARATAHRMALRSSRVAVLGGHRFPNLFPEQGQDLFLILDNDAKAALVFQDGSLILLDGLLVSFNLALIRFDVGLIGLYLRLIRKDGFLVFQDLLLIADHVAF